MRQRKVVEKEEREGKGNVKRLLKEDDLLSTSEQEELLDYFHRSFRSNLKGLYLLALTHVLIAAVYLMLLCFGSSIINLESRNNQQVSRWFSFQSKANMVGCIILYLVSGGCVLVCGRHYTVNRQVLLTRDARKGPKSTPVPQRNEEEEVEERRKMETVQRVERVEQGVILASISLSLHLLWVFIAFQRSQDRFFKEEMGLEHFYGDDSVWGFIRRNAWEIAVIAFQPLLHIFVYAVNKSVKETRAQLIKLSNLKYEYEKV